MSQIARHAGPDDPLTRARPFAAMGIAIAMALFIGSCATTPAREGLDVAQLPADVRDDYAVFSRRCSKCHALGRALNSGITDDRVWIDYVNRMRLQPGSGISQQDIAPILRFLHYHTLEKQRRTPAGEHQPPNG